MREGRHLSCFGTSFGGTSFGVLERSLGGTSCGVCDVESGLHLVGRHLVTCGTSFGVPARLGKSFGGTSLGVPGKSCGGTSSGVLLSREVIWWDVTPELLRPLRWCSDGLDLFAIATANE